VNGVRPAIAAPGGCLDFGCFALDVDTRILIDPAGRELALRRREFDLLLTFARSPGRVMSRAALLDAIAGREAEAFDRTIDVYVGRLRRKIETDPKQPRLIVTVPGVGYRLAAKPRPALPSQADAEQRPNERAICAGAGILTAFNKANLEHDAKALAALYADDAVIITTNGPLSGRTTIEKWYRENRKNYSPDPSKLEQVAAIGNDVMLRAGSWSATDYRHDAPVHLRGYWTTTDVRDGATWKIRMETTWRAQAGSGGTTPVD
jgi:uncharacterized protein (TIGR02246 family)